MPLIMLPVVSHTPPARPTGAAPVQPTDSGARAASHQADGGGVGHVSHEAAASPRFSSSSLLSLNAVLAVQQSDVAAPATDKRHASTAGPADGSGDGLSDEERATVAELKARDAEVRQHERAHAQAGGEYAGTPSYEFTEGPDGRQYAVAGQVPIDTSTIPGDPEATIDKMETVKRAALAPAQPSGQDRAVAAEADAKLTAARAELNELRNTDTAGSGQAGAAETPPGLNITI